MDWWVILGIVASIFIIGPPVLKAIKGKVESQPAPPPGWLSLIDPTELQRITGELDRAVSAWPGEKRIAAKNMLSALLANDLERCGKLSSYLNLEEFNLIKGTFDRIFLAAMKTAPPVAPMPLALSGNPRSIVEAMFGKTFLAGGRDVQLSEFLEHVADDDMLPLMMISAFAWKYSKMPPENAHWYALVTHFLRTHGTEKEKADALLTLRSAEQWTKDVGTVFMEWGLECSQKAADIARNQTPISRDQLDQILAKNPRLPLIISDFQRECASWPSDKALLGRELLNALIMNDLSRFETLASGVTSAQLNRVKATFDRIFSVVTKGVDPVVG